MNETTASNEPSGALLCSTKWRVEQFRNGAWELTYLAPTKSEAITELSRFWNYPRRVVERVIEDHVVASVAAENLLAGSVTRIS